MKQRLSDLHPNPGWGDNEPERPEPTAPSGATDMVGKHCILELYDCDQSRLETKLPRTAITTAAKRAGATLLNLITHQFGPA